MNNPRTGRFITLEGIDGSGKTTQAKILAQRVRDRGIDVHLTFEPTEGPIGQLIRRYLSGAIHLDEETVAMLFAADRLDHLLHDENGLRHTVETGRSVICDRYYFSSYAYHSVHLPLDWVIQLNSRSTGILKPDLHIFIDVPPPVCLQRLRTSGRKLERYETTEQLDRIMANYKKAFAKLSQQETVVIVNGEGDPEQVAEKTWAAVRPVLGIDD